MKMVYFAYIVTNIKNTVLYTGVTNDLRRRIRGHREKKTFCFTAKYNVSKLIWYDVFQTPQEAIAAEKRIKGWGRGKKLAMIMKINPKFVDLEIRDSSRGSK